MRLLWALGVLVSLVLCGAGCSSERRPSRATLQEAVEEAVMAALPRDSMAQLARFKIEVMENTSTKVDPVWEARFTGSLELVHDTYKWQEHDGRGTVIVRRVARKGHQVPVFGKTHSTLVGQSWQSTVQMETAFLDTLGAPLGSYFSGARIIVAGTDEERAYRKEAEADRLQEERQRIEYLRAFEHRAARLVVGEWSGTPTEPRLSGTYQSNGVFLSSVLASMSVTTSGARSYIFRKGRWSVRGDTLVTELDGGRRHFDRIAEISEDSMTLETLDGGVRRITFVRGTPPLPDVLR